MCEKDRSGGLLLDNKMISLVEFPPIWGGFPVLAVIFLPSRSLGRAAWTF